MQKNTSQLLNGDQQANLRNHPINISK